MKLKPLGDKVILRYQETEEKTRSGLILPDSAKEKPQETVVVAVGDGTGCERKNVQMQVKEGDRVIFSKYAGTEVKVEEKEYTIASQKDIIAIVQ